MRKKLLLSETEVCDLLLIKPSTILYAKIPRTKIGKYILYYYEDVREWVKNKAVNNATIPEELSDPDDEVIESISDLALLLNLPFHYVYKLVVKQKKIPHEVCNGKYYFRMEDVKAWIKSQRRITGNIKKGTCSCEVG